MTPLDKVLPRLQGVRATSPTTGRAACPGHGAGLKPSLAYRELEDGRLLLRCFAGCEVADIVDALGLTMADLFPESTYACAPIVGRVFNAHDVLHAVGAELVVAVATLRAWRNGDELTAEAWARFDLCVTRLVAAEGLANG
jgi:hypothetical protein